MERMISLHWWGEGKDESAECKGLLESTNEDSGPSMDSAGPPPSDRQYLTWYNPSHGHGPTLNQRVMYQ